MIALVCPRITKKAKRSWRMRTLVSNRAAAAEMRDHDRFRVPKDKPDG